MNLLCKLVGHKPQEGVYSGAEYMAARHRTTDGIGREHWVLIAQCARCNSTYRAGMLHGPLTTKETS